MTAGQSRQLVQPEEGYVLQTAGSSGRLCHATLYGLSVWSAKAYIEIEPTDAAATIVATTSNQEGNSRP